MCDKCTKKVVGQLIVATESRLRELCNHLTDEHFKDPSFQLELRNLSDMIDKVIKKIK